MLADEVREDEDRIRFMEETEKEINEYSSMADMEVSSSVLRKNIFRFLIILIASLTAVAIISTLVIISVFYEPAPRKRLILLSFDGFAAHYLENYPHLLKTFKKVQREGISTPHMSPIFPSKTFVNHYSVVTGLYSESNGIIGNYMFDPVLNRTFTMRDSMDPVWWEGEPIWVTAAKNDIKSGIVFWPGSEVKIKGIRPNFYHKFSNDKTNQWRLDELFKFIDHPEKPRLIQGYFQRIDDMGHRHGPNSTEVQIELKNADLVLEQLLYGLEKRKMLDDFNIVITSDHGMTEKKKIIFLDEIVSNFFDRIDFYQWNPRTIYPQVSLNIQPKQQNDRSKILEELKKSNEMDCYDKLDMPNHWFINNTVRTSDIFCVGKLGTLLTTDRNITHPYSPGNHGYDNIEPDMNSIFFAFGPSIVQSKIEPFVNIEVYNLMIKLLNIENGAPNNGTLDWSPHLKKYGF
eukprot:gene4626-8199_t